MVQVCYEWVAKVSFHKLHLVLIHLNLNRNFILIYLNSFLASQIRLENLFSLANIQLLIIIVSTGYLSSVSAPLWHLVLFINLFI